MGKRLDKLVAELVAEGLVEGTGWPGRPLLVTPLPASWLDEDEIRRTCQFFQLLTQVMGRWAGQRFTLLDWQVRWIVGPMFGLKDPKSGLRVVRTGWVEECRKNGKSTICSGFGLKLAFADREPGAQVYAAAGDKAQARNVFDTARRIAAGSKQLADRLGKRGIQRSLLEHPETGSIFRVLSSDGDRQHGLNVHGAVIDEVHVHKNPDLVDALETGTGSRTQPLVVFITTADAGEDGSIYATKREYLEGVVAGHISAPSFYGVVFAADPSAPGFDPFSDEAIIQANPGIGFTVSHEYLRARADEARQSPAQLNRYLRLHLGIRTKQVTRWLDLADWDACGQLVDAAEWDGRVARGGLDLSTASDLTAFVLKSGDLVHPMFWLPEEQVGEVERRCGVPLRQWAAAGFLRLTEGNVVDYAKVRSDITAEIERLGCHVGSIGYDPWNASETVTALENEGFVMVPIRQGYSTLSAPAKHLERLVAGSSPSAPLLRHGGHPVLRWNADCVEVRSDDSGNIKPVKPDRQRSAKRIDGVVALIMAAREEMLGADEERSAAADYLAAMSAQMAR